MKDYANMSDFEINKRVAISLDIDMHFYIPESEDSFQPGFLPTELGPIWQTSAGFVGELTVSNGNMFNPCNNPADAWPIIDENNITIINDHPGIRYAVNNLNAYRNGDRGCIVKSHSNGLRAAMIVFLKMKESE